MVFETIHASISIFLFNGFYFYSISLLWLLRTDQYVLALVSELFNFDARWQSTFTWPPKWTQTAVKCFSVYMAIPLRATLKSQTTLKNYPIYMEISLWQLSKPYIARFYCTCAIRYLLINANLNWCKIDVGLLVVF